MGIKHPVIKKIYHLDCNAENELEQDMARGKRTKNDEFLKSFQGKAKKKQNRACCHGSDSVLIFILR